MCCRQEGSSSYLGDAAEMVFDERQCEFQFVIVDCSHDLEPLLQQNAFVGTLQCVERWNFVQYFVIWIEIFLLVVVALFVD